MFLLINILIALAVNPHIAPQLPKARIAQKFMESEKGFLERWQVFKEGRIFIPFQEGKKDAELEDEFREIRKIRNSVWFLNPAEAFRESSYGYEISESLLFGDAVRVKNCIAFAYNNTVPYYNASTIHLGGRILIACEGPREKDVAKFFQMIATYHITHLIRLTTSRDGEHEKCYPYWKGHYIPHHLEQVGSGTWPLHVPLGDGITYPIRNYVVEDWVDQQGLEPARLLGLVREVKKDLDETNGLLAVHCSAGVGRTGTFLAAIAIADAVDRGEDFSIEEIVYKLSLQRFNSVSTPKQYIALHRFAEAYIASIGSFQKFLE